MSGFETSVPFRLGRRNALGFLAGGTATALLAGCGSNASDSADPTAMMNGNKDMDLTGGLPVDREYFIHDKPEAEFRDAANFWIEERNGAFGMRIGIEHLAEEWATPELWLDIAFPDGRVISGREYGSGEIDLGPDGKPTKKRCGPLRIQCVEPFKHWKITFEPHRVRELSTRQLIDQAIPEEPPMRETAFEIDIFPAAPPLISGTLTAKSKEAMSGEQGSFISPRYEQQCRVKGWLSLDGDRKDFEGQALRIKRQGVRKFDGFWGHCWMSALFPSGKAFGVNTFPPRDDGKPSFNEGFIFDGSGALIPARAVEIPWMERLLERDEPVKLVLETDDGRRETIEGVTYVNCRSVTNNATFLPDQWPIVQQSHATYTWNGETATGMLERSTFEKDLKA